MNNIEYTEFTRTTRLNMPVKEEMILPILALGLAGEAGEVCDKIKKSLRTGGEQKLVIDDIEKELGDVMWYLTSIADELGLTLDDIMKTNIDKIESRVARGVLYGSGDNR